ncbi:MAG: peptidoglycan bridge formation glycyltransferase FemA/FemB family protein [Candidatus Paceibacterota bacterium]
MQSKSFLQTEDWLGFQESLGRKVWRFAAGPDEGRNTIMANIIKHDLPLGKSYLYIPHGPVLNFDNFGGGVKNEIDNFFKHLKDLAKENKSIFVKMEPISDSVMELIFRKRMKKADSLQPQKTVIMDLEQSEEELLSKMHHKTRYNINLASRKGLVFKESDDVKIFWDLLRKTAKKDKFQTHEKHYYFELYDFFKNKEDVRVELFTVDYEGKAVAGALIMFYGDTAYYLHGAMDRGYKEFMAPYFMHWEIAKHAKSAGHKYYDFWGIDARRWPGVTRFKLGWGGRQVEYPGSFDIPISNFWYLLYRVVRKIF